MLTRRLLATTVLTVLLALAAPAAAHADPAPTPGAGGNCDQNPDPSCITWGGGGGGNGGGGSGGGSRAGCTWRGQTMLCSDPDYGRYMGGGCYWEALNPPPAISPPVGKDPTKGAWGVKTCYSSPNGGAVTQAYFWLDNTAGGPTPAQLAQQALAKIHLLGARIGIAPRPGGSGAVGLPVWLWTTVTAGTWGPLSASASAGGVTVTITARASRIVWNMGDGGQVSCANPGTAYQARYGMASSPTCGYTYTTPSSTTGRPHGRYTITATTYWTVNWAGGGQTGVLNPTSQAQTSVEIGEIQVVGQ